MSEENNVVILYIYIFNSGRCTKSRTQIGSQGITLPGRSEFSQAVITSCRLQLRTVIGRSSSTHLVTAGKSGVL